jgi:hypothetical protein
LYTRAGWEALPRCGEPTSYHATASEPEMLLELRNCPCGNTLAIDLTLSAPPELLFDLACTPEQERLLDYLGAAEGAEDQDRLLAELTRAARERRGLA